MVSQNPVSPAVATGIVQTGLSLGAPWLCPMLIGLVSEYAGYDTAWAVASILSACGATVVLIGRRHLRHTRRRASVANLHEVEPLRWEDAVPESVTEGVEVQQRDTTNLEVSLNRLAAGARYVPPLASRTGILSVLEGEAVHVRIRGVEIIATPEDRLPLPANRQWQLHNRGEQHVTIAQLGHRGNASVAGEPSVV